MHYNAKGYRAINANLKSTRVTILPPPKKTSHFVIGSSFVKPDGKYYRTLLQISHSFQRQKNFANQLRFDKVIANYNFLGHDVVTQAMLASKTSKLSKTKHLNV